MGKIMKCILLCGVGGLLLLGVSLGVQGFSGATV